MAPGGCELRGKGALNEESKKVEMQLVGYMRLWNCVKEGVIEAFIY